jgi:hypothetical protein
MEDILNVDILDGHFGHVKNSSGPWQEINNFQWNRNNFRKKLIFFTDSSIKFVDQIDSEKKIAWLIESPLVMQEEYDLIKRIYKKFDIILTHSKELIELDDRFKLCPIGGCWIEKESIKIHNKKKSISIISSEKNSLEGHKLRQQVIEEIKNIDVFGRNRNFIDKKSLGLNDYMYSISIENCRKDFYFTEKIIDCFATGTIPIYWGCPSIGNFFDKKGIISENNINLLIIFLI